MSAHPILAESETTDIGPVPEWNLKDFYPSIQAVEIERDLTNADQFAQRFAKQYQKRVEMLAADDFTQAVREYEALQELMGKIGSYAQLVYSENMALEAHTQFYQNVQERLNQISARTLFFTLEINKMKEAEIDGFLKNYPRLRPFAPWLRDVRAFLPYQLPDDIEKMLHEKAVTGQQAWQRLFDETIAALRFPWEGKMVSNAEIFDKLSCKDRILRRQAGKSIGKVLEDNGKIFAMVTNVLAKDKALEDGWRKFPRPISSRNLVNYIEDEVVDTLIESVKRAYPKLSHRYYSLKAKWLGLPKLEYWDRNAPLPEFDDRKIPWQEAKTLVLDAYQAFSPTMAEIGERFFSKHWIDAKVKEGKDPGAFSHPAVSSIHPYILMNYQGKSRDVMTLAHELGHGIHQVLAGKHGPLMSDTPLTLAETASVFGEQLTFRALIAAEQDPKKRQALIAAKVEDMLNTVVRQVAFSEYERLLHQARKEGELSLEQIGELWMQVQQESLGPAFHFDEEYRHYWMYIPHFIHSPFYVYAYAFGDCLVNSLYAVYERQPQGFEQKYLTMLKAGGTLRHRELLAPFGLDASDPEFWDGGLATLSGFIDMLEQ